MSSDQAYVCVYKGGIIFPLHYAHYQQASSYRMPHVVPQLPLFSVKTALFSVKTPTSASLLLWKLDKFALTTRNEVVLVDKAKWLAKCKQ